MHNYLFFRLPLIRPQKFLQATLPYANLLASRAVGFVILLAFCLGTYFALRQWDQFVSTVPELFSIEGAILLAIAIAGLKAAHELGTHTPPCVTVATFQRWEWPSW